MSSFVICPKCGKQSKDSNTFCPSCGSPLNSNTNTASSYVPPKKKKSPILAGCLGCLGFFFLIGILGSIGANINEKPSSSTDTPSTQAIQNKTTSSEETRPDENKPDLEVLSADWSKTQYDSDVIVGTVKNNTNHEYGYVQIEFNLYDANGSQVGSAMANVNNLEPKSTWKYQAIVLEDTAHSFKLKGVSGF